MELNARHRRRSLAVMPVALAVAVSACSTPSPPEIGASPKVTSSGKHYSFGAAHVAKSRWPNPCSLLTRASAEAAIGTAVTVKRFHTNCYYQPITAVYPRLTITLLSVGTGSDTTFGKAHDNSSGENPSSVPNVGRAAFLHRVRTLPAYRLDVLTRYAHFAVSEQSPFSQRLTPAQARALLVVVGRAVAKAFKG